MLLRISKIAARVAAVALLASCFLPGAASAFVAGQDRGLAIAASPDAAPIDKIGCYRLGFSGYHWYHFCAGPGFLYPHHRACHHGHCYYH